MRSVGTVTQFVLNRSRRNNIEVQRFRQRKNKGNKGILQYNSNEGGGKKVCWHAKTADPEVKLKADFP